MKYLKENNLHNPQFQSGLFRFQKRRTLGTLKANKPKYLLRSVFCKADDSKSFSFYTSNNFRMHSKKLKNFHLNALKVDNQSGNFLNASSNSKISKFSENPSFPPTYWNQCFDKSRLKNFILWFVLHYGEQKTLELVEELKTLGFKYATKAGISLGIDDLKIPPKKADLIFEGEKVTSLTTKQYKRGEITGVERFQRLIDTWHRTSENLKQEVIHYFESTDTLNPVYMMAFSGARGNISQVRQLVGMRGLMSNPQGQIIDYPIRSNFREGLTLTEYIISSYGARKGIVDTALRTANAGYLTRRLVDVAQHVIISNFDCKTNAGIFLTDMKEGNKILYSLQNRLVGRVLAENLQISDTKSGLKPSMASIGEGNLNPHVKKDKSLLKPIKILKKNTEISLDLSFNIAKSYKKVFVRSVLTCKNQKLVCQLCYGWSLAQGNLVSIGEAVGIIAAQSIGEPGTQLTMRTFHTGGVFSGGVTDQIKAPFDGLIEYGSPIPGKLIRTPEGQISFLTTNEGFFVIRPFDKSKQKNIALKKYKIPTYTLLFKRMGEQVFSNEVIAQISALSKQKNATDDAELTIKSELEGQLYGKGILVKLTDIGPKLRKDEGWNQIPFDPLFQAAYWGDSWILSGKIYKLPVPSSFFPIVGDLINRKTVMNQIKWKFHNEGFFNSSSIDFYPLSTTLKNPGFTEDFTSFVKKSNFVNNSFTTKKQQKESNSFSLKTGLKNNFVNIDNTIQKNPYLKKVNDTIDPYETNQKGLLNVPVMRYSLLSLNLQNIIYKKSGYLIKVPSGINPTLFSPISQKKHDTFKNFSTLSLNGRLQFNKNKSSLEVYNKTRNSLKRIRQNLQLNQVQDFQSKYKKIEKLSKSKLNVHNSLSEHDILLLISPLKSKNKKWKSSFLSESKKLRSSSSRLYFSNPEFENSLNSFLNLSKSPSNWIPTFKFFLTWYPANFQILTPGLISLENDVSTAFKTSFLSGLKNQKGSCGFLPTQNPRFFIFNKKYQMPSETSKYLEETDQISILKNKNKFETNFYLKMTPKGIIKVVSIDKERKYKFQLSFMSKKKNQFINPLKKTLSFEEKQKSSFSNDTKQKLFVSLIKRDFIKKLEAQSDFQDLKIGIKKSTKVSSPHFNDFFKVSKTDDRSSSLNLLIKDKNINPFKKEVIAEQNLKFSQKLFQRPQNSQFMHFGVHWKNSYNYQIKKARTKSNFKIEKNLQENLEWTKIISKEKGSTSLNAGESLARVFVTPQFLYQIPLSYPFVFLNSKFGDSNQFSTLQSQKLDSPFCYQINRQGSVKFCYFLSNNNSREFTNQVFFQPPVSFNSERFSFVDLKDFSIDWSTQIHSFPLIDRTFVLKTIKKYLSNRNFSSYEIKNVVELTNKPITLTKQKMKLHLHSDQQETEIRASNTDFSITFSSNYHIPNLDLKTNKEINTKNQNSILKMKLSSSENSQEMMIWLTRIFYFFHSTCSSLQSFSKTIEYVWMFENYNFKNFKSKNLKNHFPKKKKLLAHTSNSEKNSIFNFCVLSCIQKKSRQIWEINPNFKKNKSFVELYKKDENIETRKTFSQSSSLKKKLPIQMFKFYIGWVSLKNILSKFIKTELNKKQYFSISTKKIHDFNLTEDLKNKTEISKDFLIHTKVRKILLNPGEILIKKKVLCSKKDILKFRFTHSFFNSSTQKIENKKLLSIMLLNLSSLNLDFVNQHKLFNQEKGEKTFVGFKKLNRVNYYIQNILSLKQNLLMNSKADLSNYSKKAKMNFKKSQDFYSKSETFVNSFVQEYSTQSSLSNNVSSLSILIKSGWVYFCSVSNLPNDLSYVSPGQVILENLVFDNHICYLEFLENCKFKNLTQTFHYNYSFAHNNQISHSFNKGILKSFNFEKNPLKPEIDWNNEFQETKKNLTKGFSFQTKESSNWKWVKNKNVRFLPSILKVHSSNLVSENHEELLPIQAILIRKVREYKQPELWDYKNQLYNSSDHSFAKTLISLTSNLFVESKNSEKLHLIKELFYKTELQKTLKIDKISKKKPFTNILKFLEKDSYCYILKDKKNRKVLERSFENQKLNSCSCYKLTKGDLFFNKKYFFNKSYISLTLKNNNFIIIPGLNESKKSILKLKSSPGFNFIKKSLHENFAYKKTHQVFRKQNRQTISKFPSIDLKLVSNFKFVFAEKSKSHPLKNSSEKQYKRPLTLPISYLKPKTNSLFLSYDMSHGFQDMFEKDIYLFNYKNLRLTFSESSFYQNSLNLNLFLKDYILKLKVPNKQSLMNSGEKCSKLFFRNFKKDMFSLVPIFLYSPYFSYNLIQQLDPRFLVDNHFLRILASLNIKNEFAEPRNLSLMTQKIEIQNKFLTSGNQKIRSAKQGYFAGITSSYSPFRGEIIYTKDLDRIKKSLESYSLKNDSKLSHKGSEKNKQDLFLDLKPHKKFSDSNLLQNNALILTKEDLVCVSLKPISKGSSLNIVNQNKKSEAIKNKEETQILNLNLFKSINLRKNGSIQSLDLLLQPARLQKKQISSKKSVTTTNRFSKYHIQNILKELETQSVKKTAYYLNDMIIKYQQMTRIKKTARNNLANARYLINKLAIGLPIQRNNLSLGEFFKYGDQFKKKGLGKADLTMLETGQIIHLSKDKVTLRRGQRIKISINAILHKYHRDLIIPQSPVITLAYSQLKTGDIVQGIPKIEQFFEARTTKRGRLFRDSLPNLLQALFKYNMSNLTNDDAARESVYKIQQILIDGVQRVYRGQGVTIADKHLEVIVKQMTSKARILKGGCTGYLTGDVDDLFFIETVFNQYPYEFEYEPLILGISKTSLEVKSFLSAASFQHTTRVLTKAAIYRETDYLSGLKENILLGNLIPAGTGYLVSVESKTDSKNQPTL